MEISDKTDQYGFSAQKNGFCKVNHFINVENFVIISKQNSINKRRNPFHKFEHPVSKHSCSMFSIIKYYVASNIMLILNTIHDIKGPDY